MFTSFLYIKMCTYLLGEQMFHSLQPGDISFLSYDQVEVGWEDPLSNRKRAGTLSTSSWPQAALSTQQSKGTGNRVPLVKIYFFAFFCQLRPACNKHKQNEDAKYTSRQRNNCAKCLILYRSLYFGELHHESVKVL